MVKMTLLQNAQEPPTSACGRIPAPCDAAVVRVVAPPPRLQVLTGPNRDEALLWGSHTQISLIHLPKLNLITQICPSSPDQPFCSFWHETTLGRPDSWSETRVSVLHADRWQVYVGARAENAIRAMPCLLPPLPRPNEGSAGLPTVAMAFLEVDLDARGHFRALYCVQGHHLWRCGPRPEAPYCLGSLAHFEGRALFSRHGEWAAWLSPLNELTIGPPERHRWRCHQLPQNYQYTAVSLRPADYARAPAAEIMVAVGDALGKIHLLRSVQRAKEKPQLVFSFVHWHSLPVRALAWSSSGVSLFSGGGEEAVVKWRAEDGTREEVAPRLGDAVAQICVAPASGSVLAVLDNGQLIHLDPQLRPRGHLLLDILDDARPWCFHRPSATVAMLSPSGVSLQFYNAKERKTTMTLRVDDRNLIRGHRNPLSMPARPQSVFGVSLSGAWLATTHEGCLKIWNFSVLDKEFRLAAKILMPHLEEDVAQLAIYDGKEDDDDDEFGVTLLTASSSDLRVWQQLQGQWGLKQRVTFKSRTPRCFARSVDASVLAVGFGGSCITLWHDDGKRLAATIGGAGGDKTYTSLLFGQTDLRTHFLFCADADGVDVWDTIRFRLVKRIPAKNAFLRETRHHELLVCPDGLFAVSDDLALVQISPTVREVVCDTRGRIASVKREAAYLNADWLQQRGPERSLAGLQETGREENNFKLKREEGKILDPEDLSKPLSLNLTALLKKML